MMSQGKTAGARFSGFRSVWGLVALGLCLSAPVQSGQDSPAQAYQQGLFQLHSQGALGAAMDSFDQVLEGQASQDLLDAARLGRAECLRLLGRTEESLRTIGGLRREVAGRLSLLGAAIDLPRQSDLIFHLDLTRMDLSDLADRLRISIPKSDLKLVRAFESALGLKLTRDIHRLTIGLNLRSDPRHLFDHFAVVVDGDFRNLKLDGLVAVLNILALAHDGEQTGQRPYLLRGDNPKKFVLVVTTEDEELQLECCPGKRNIALELSQQDIQGYPAILASFREQKSGELIVQLALLKTKQDRILFGERRALDKTLDAQAGRLLGVGANRELMEMAARLPADSALWLLVRPEPMFEQLEAVHSLLGLQDELPEVEGVVLYSRLKSELFVHASAVSRNRQAARVLADLALGSKAILRVAAATADEEDAAWINLLLNGTEVRVSGRELVLKANLPLPAPKPKRSPQDL